MNLKMILQLLAVALNPSTPSGEADAAIRKAGNLGQEDGTVASLLGSLQKMREGKAKAERERSQCQSTIKELRAQNQSLQIKTEQFQVEIKNLRAEVGALKATASDDGRSYITFDAFAASAGGTYGRKLWKTAFAFEAGITIKEISAWETVGLAPAGWLAKLDALTDEQRKPTARKPWTDEERRHLRTVLDQGHTDLAAARILTTDFGRRIYESSVTNQRRQLFRQEGWAPQNRPGTGRSRGQPNAAH